MLRAAYWLSAVIYLPLGVLLYFFPSSLSQLLSLSPLWLARLSGALLTAWGGLLIAAAFHPDSVTRYGVAAANLLAVGTLVPAALKGSVGTVGGLVLSVSAVLGVAGILALIGGGRRA
ncbi:hypothetical protein FNU79_08910 [Deinococcus detaillensis]|uniref:Uncharacterized protein n=1 Tax=Deinococcus detaillensis TaxID=2592048 RepID=A0A553V0B0_9DEIO|nr:hypothetical protein [Deinococcus detaillensis]TSA85889.1 hypothetical protein FNU79_08910 [Deinococcus detaillensis]